MYDKLKSFVRLVPKDEKGSKELKKLINKHGYLGARMYLWVKREGQNLRIFVDEFPP